jgi:hypothetical protein
LKKDALVLEAKQDLYYNYPLQKGQALINITVDISNRFFVVYHEKRVTVSAVVIDFNLNEENNEIYFKRDAINYTVGDSVLIFLNSNLISGKY